MNTSTNKRRRSFIKAVFGGAISGLMLRPSHSAAAVADNRELQFFHTHTLKRLSVTYKRENEYVQDALSNINAFLFDFRTGDLTNIDPQLIDLIYDIRQALGSKGTY